MSNRDYGDARRHTERGHACLTETVEIQEGTQKGDTGQLRLYYCQVTAKQVLLYPRHMIKVGRDRGHNPNHIVSMLGKTKVGDCDIQNKMHDNIKYK